MKNGMLTEYHCKCILKSVIFILPIINLARGASVGAVHRRALLREERRGQRAHQATYRAGGLRVKDEVLLASSAPLHCQGFRSSVSK